MENLKEYVKIVHILGAIMFKYPHLRFLQVIGNCFKSSEDTYYVSNKEFIRRLKKTYKEVLK